jgi:catechol 2,3-dioxygenase-like lactoylglutathione lyase family enzyme
MSTILIDDIAYVRFAAPDLDVMRGFLEDFGLTLVQATSERLAMRGAAEAPFLHMTELGEARFVALGLRAVSLADLATLAQACGTRVETLDAPGGGHVVRLTDPDGHLVEVVAGQEPSPPLELPAAPAWNSARGRERVRQTKRLARDASHVVRLGHCVLNVSDFRASERWYKERFGFITSDEIEAAPGFAIGAFLRCDRGDRPTDHHTLFLVQHPKGAGFNHAAFEVADLDDLMTGHERLKAHGRTPDWGVGRHILGSQVFDYWRDPWSHVLEHWTDGDLFVADDGSRTATLQDLMSVQWGPPAPPLG